MWMGFCFPKGSAAGEKGGAGDGDSTRFNLFPKDENRVTARVYCVSHTPVGI